MKRLMIALLLCGICCMTLPAQELEISSSRRTVRTSGDVGAALLPIAGVTAALIQKDWDGLKQGAIAGVSTVGITYLLKLIFKKERPDRSDKHSFPSMHTSTSFVSAAFIQQRYGWKWAIPAYAVSTYVGWSRVYGKKHDWFDVAAGAAIGIGSACLYTRPYAKKRDQTLNPLAGNGYYGFYVSIFF